MSVSGGRPGVLLLHYGAPRDEGEVAAFLGRIAGGRPVPEVAVAEYLRRFRLCGGSPLPALVEETRGKLEAELQASLPGCLVRAGALFGRPDIHQAIRELAEGGATRAVAIVLVPQSTPATTGRYLAALQVASESLAGGPRLTVAASWETQPCLVKAYAEKVRVALAGQDPQAMPTIFTAHSVPVGSLAEGDPFVAELTATADAVATAVRLKQWQLAYQSAGRAPGPWLGPTVGESVANLAQQGVAEVLVVPLHFLFDNLETLYDLDVQLRQQAESLGLRLHRASAPNGSPLLVRALAELAEDALSR